MAVFQIELNDDLQNKFQDICNYYGIKIEEAIKLFVSTTVQEDDFPFRLPAEILSRKKPNLDDEIFRSRDGSDSLLKSIFAYSAWAKETGLSEMTLDEINAEINAAREERTAKEDDKKQKTASVTSTVRPRVESK